MLFALRSFFLSAAERTKYSFFVGNAIMRVKAVKNRENKEKRRMDKQC